MTAHQRNLSASIDPVKLDRLAEVAVKVGLRLQPGQDLLLTAPSVALPLVRRIAEHAYKAGAGIVTPFLSDEEITLARYRYGHNESFDHAAGWLYEGMAKAFTANTARLAIVGDNPMLLSGEDPAKVARASKANSIAYQPALEKIVNFETNWNIIAYPSPSWAKQVFPGCSGGCCGGKTGGRDLCRVARRSGRRRRGLGKTQRRATRADRVAERPALPRAEIFRPGHRPDASGLPMATNGKAAPRPPGTASPATPTSRPRKSSPRRIAGASAAMSSPPSRCLIRAR